MSSSDLPPFATPAPAPAPTPAPAKKSNTLVIVLCVVFGLMFLALASCVGTCVYLGKKAKAYAKDSEKNPQISTLAMVAAMTPGIEVVSKDLDAGTIELRNKKTGEVIKLDAKNFSSDKISSVIEKIAQGKGVNVSSDSATTASKATPADTGSATSSPSETVSDAQSAALDATLKNFRPDFPVYSGSGITTTEAAQNTVAGISTAQHVFETSDSPQKVLDFYVKKLTADGYTVLAGDDSSDSNGPKLSRVFQKGGMGTTLNLEVEVEDGKTHVAVNQVVLKK